MNEAAAQKKEGGVESGNIATSHITPQMKMVLDYLQEYGEMSEEDLQELLNIKKTRSYLLTRQMSEDGLIEIVGRGAAKKYKMKKNARAALQQEGQHK